MINAFCYSLIFHVQKFHPDMMKQEVDGDKISFSCQG